MPTATDELRYLMDKYFGDPIDMYGPSEYLRDRGFIEKKGIIRPPSMDYELSKKEADCIEFLFQEWDYGYEDGSD